MFLCTNRRWKRIFCGDTRVSPITSARCSPREADCGLLRFIANISPALQRLLVPVGPDAHGDLWSIPRRVCPVFAVVADGRTGAAVLIITTKAICCGLKWRQLFTVKVVAKKQLTI